jgi:hypothetical protein
MTSEDDARPVPEPAPDSTEPAPSQDRTLAPLPGDSASTASPDPTSTAPSDSASKPSPDSAAAPSPASDDLASTPPSDSPRRSTAA